MNLLDWDCDEKKYEITIEINYKELLHIVSSIESMLHCLPIEYERKLMQEIHDTILNEIINKNYK